MTGRNPDRGPVTGTRKARYNRARRRASQSVFWLLGGVVITRLCVVLGGGGPGRGVVGWEQQNDM